MSATWLPTVVGTPAISADGCRAQVNISVALAAHVNYGAPQQLSLVYAFDERQDGSIGLNATVTWRNKTATRLAESLWWSFDPHPQVHNPLVGEEGLKCVCPEEPLMVRENPAASFCSLCPAPPPLSFPTLACPEH